MKSTNSGPVAPGTPGRAPRRAFSLTDSLWRVFVSVRLTITLLLLLTAFSVAGSLIAQQGQTQVPIETLYTPEVLRWLVAFGLTDIFHSAVFVFLLMALALNLLACSIERLPKVWREAFYVAPPPVEDPTLKEWTPEIARIRKYLVERPGRAGFESAREAKMAAMLFFQKRFSGKYTVLRDDDDQFQLMVEEGKYSRVGVYITHLSLLLIMFGGAAGAIWGFEGGMSIEEGTRQSWLQHLKGSNGGLNLMRENGKSVPGFLNLGFEVECESFTLETYDGERPKLFKSTLNFYENDVKVHSADIAVNHPTNYKGMTFYQASFSEVGVGGVDLRVFRVAQAPKRGRNPSQVRPQVVAPDGQRAADTAPRYVDPKQAVLGGGSAAAPPPPSIKPQDAQLTEALPGMGHGVKGAPSLMPGAKMPAIESVELVERVRPGDVYRVDGDAAFKIIQVEANLMDLGPAAKMQFFPSKHAKKPTEFWVFKNLPGFDFAHRSGSHLHFVLESVRPKYATGLSVAKDPGVWIVWAGCLILTCALFMALYTCHSRYWLAYTPQTGFVVVGWSNKLFLFEPRFERFFAAFKQEFKV